MKDIYKSFATAACNSAHRYQPGAVNKNVVAFDWRSFTDVNQDVFVSSERVKASVLLSEGIWASQISFVLPPQSGRDGGGGTGRLLTFNPVSKPTCCPDKDEPPPPQHRRRMERGHSSISPLFSLLLLTVSSSFGVDQGTQCSS